MVAKSSRILDIVFLMYPSHENLYLIIQTVSYRRQSIGFNPRPCK